MTFLWFDHTLSSNRYYNCAASTVWYLSTFTLQGCPSGREEKMPCVLTKLVFWMAWGQCLQCPTDIFMVDDVSETTVGIIQDFYYICNERTVNV